MGTKGTKQNVFMGAVPIIHRKISVRFFIHVIDGYIDDHDNFYNQIYDYFAVKNGKKLFLILIGENDCFLMIPHDISY